MRFNRGGELGRIGFYGKFDSLFQRVNFTLFNLFGGFAVVFAAALYERADFWRFAFWFFGGGSVCLFLFFLAGLAFFLGLDFFYVFLGLFAGFGKMFFFLYFLGDFCGLGGLVSRISI